MLRTNSDFGIPRADWDAAKLQARQAMIEVARKRGMITYSDLVKQITAIQFDPYDIRLFHMLGEVSSEEYNHNRGMLTAVVVHKYGDMEPGSGFWILADHLGLKITNKLELWISELHKVHRVWSTPNG